MEDLDKLPLPLLIAAGMGLAVIFGVRYLGLLSGERASPGGNVASAQVAAVIVDSTALNRFTEQTAKLTSVLDDLVEQVREGVRTNSILATELDRIREELRIQREIARRGS